MYRLIIDGQYVPIPPEKISIKVDGDNKTMTLINLGEVNILRNPKLTEISFDLLLPNQYYPFAFYSDGKYKGADEYIKKYKELLSSKKAFKLEIYRYAPNDKKIFNTILTVSLERLTITDSVSDGFDSRVSLEFEEYRKYVQEFQPEKAAEISRPLRSTVSSSMYRTWPSWKMASRSTVSGSPEASPKISS